MSRCSPLFWPRCLVFLRRMSEPEQWPSWCEVMRRATTSQEVRRSLFVVSEAIASSIQEDPWLIREWASIGIEVELRPLAVSGVCIRGTRRVLVRRHDSARRRRYTVAHEVGHLLLAHATESANLRLSRRAEEDLCERFASSTLVPHRRLARYLDEHPPAPSLEWLAAATEYFRVSHSALVIALSQHTWSTDAAFVLVRHHGHPKRPWQTASRVAVAACPSRLKFPRHKRLSSLGWGTLADWAAEQEPGTVRRARDASIELLAGAAAPPGTASFVGVAASEAMTVAGVYQLVMACDTSALRRKPYRGRRLAAKPSSEAQLAIVLA